MRKLSTKQRQALELIAAGWRLIGPAQFAHRALASPIEKRGAYIYRKYFPVAQMGTLSVLCGRKLIRYTGGRFHDDNLAITSKGRAAIAEARS